VIRQFQDLERQLQQARQQLAHFRSVVPKGALAMDVDLGSPLYHGTEIKPVGSPPPRRKKPTVLRDFSQVRANLTDYGRGLLQIPSPYRESIPQIHKPLDMPNLPPRHIADHFLTLYRENFHVQFPILHWSTFQAECDELYRTQSLATLGNAWGAVFLCVLACGTLHTLDSSRTQDGRAFLTTAIGMTNRWQDEFSIDDARMAFLAGVFLTELNLKSAGWVWLGSAIRISQDLDLHVESGPWSTIEGEMRRRLWYCIYAWDRLAAHQMCLRSSTNRSRLLALELGKPLLIKDEDYDTDYPEPADDEQITNVGINSTGQSTPLLAIVNVVRLFQSLSQLLKSPYITRDTLQSREDYLQTCLSLFPTSLQPSAMEPLDPRTMAPLICLQNARLLLQRHNLTPMCPPNLRLQAIDQCVMVARETALALSRCLAPAIASQHAPADNSRLLAISASTLLCMHIWRCLLFLLFRADYVSAIILVQAASAIGAARKVNLYCGRHVEFFLQVLYSRLQQGHSGDFDEDEELIAYVSGDLQSNPDTSWIWQGTNAGIESSNLAKTVQEAPAFDRAFASPTNQVKGPIYAELDAKDWGAWDRIEHSVRYLLEQQEKQGQQSQSQIPPQQPASVSPPSDTSRMTIANII
jgi:Fungal specific transcription factor domain